MKSLVRVEILGREYVLKSDEEEGRVEKIAAYVNQKIREVSGGPQTVSTLNAAILAALNIADEYFKVLEEKGGHRQDYEGKAEHLIAMIDARIRE
jgi:cell division protein ZapA